jgi:hypothetical protein
MDCCQVSRETWVRLPVRELPMRMNLSSSPEAWWVTVRMMVLLYWLFAGWR